MKKNRRKVERPPKEELIKLINDIGYSATGRKYGVSDNAIRKWLKYY
jgi:transposase-like protein